MKTQKNPRIAIIGGGPGGLTLACILQERGIAASVFEREHDPEFRPQGGTLDLHPESGLRAVHLAGLDTEFHAIARYEDQGMRRLNPQGTVLFDIQPQQGQADRPEVDRTALRAMLLASLDPGVVCWGYNLRSLVQADDDTYELHFENGVRETFDFVVGADGTWSRVRPFLSSAVPEYTGVTFIEFGLDNVDQDHLAVAQLVGHGSMFAMGDNQALIAQRNAHEHIRVYAAMRVPQTWVSTAGFDPDAPLEARAWLLKQFAGWGPQLLALIQESGDRFVNRPLFMLHVGHCWKFHAGVTLLGDAAHVMSPFSGEGVNLAMTDAADLACALSEAQNLAKAQHDYEDSMLSRALVTARGAEEGIRLAISANGATHLPPAVFQQ